MRYVFVLLLLAACGSANGNPSSLKVIDQAWDVVYDDLGKCVEYHTTDHTVITICEESEVILILDSCEGELPRMMENRKEN